MIFRVSEHEVGCHDNLSTLLELADQLEQLPLAAQGKRQMV